MNDQTRPIQQPDRGPSHDAAVRFRAGRLPEFTETYTRLHSLVGPESWELVLRLLDLTEETGEDAGNSAVVAMIHDLAQHFPGLAPAIRAVGRHIVETGRPEDCGVRWEDQNANGGPGWVGCLGPDQTDGGAA